MVIRKPLNKKFAGKARELILLLDKDFDDGVTLITPTGDRHRAFSFCEEYISNQTYDGPLQWIVSDDGNEKLKPTCNQLHLQHEPVNSKTKSICRNIRTALYHVKYKNIFIIEDDDYYRPNYIERGLHRLNSYQLIGEADTRYYNIQQLKYRINHNKHHASLFQTALKIDAIEHLYVSTLRSTSAFIDCRLWNKNLRKAVFGDEITSIGMKGIGGRPGIGNGHRPGNSYRDDPNYKVLKSWLDNDRYFERYVEIHKEFLQKMKLQREQDIQKGRSV